ncbi:MAG: TIGR01777 family oxidoreductase [Verrucomicrobia bacterium]|nr:TIGR01777 family oxidoreductase [Verrucomicrobiota bacterium]
MRLLTYQSRIELPAQDVFAWHKRPGALERLLPPWERVRIVERSGGLEPGGRVVLRTGLGPLPVTWEAVHQEYKEGLLFVDRLARGPFAHWEHAHRFTSEGTNACLVEDRISYRLPLGFFGQTFAGKAVRRRLKRMFGFRHERLRNDLLRHAACKQFGSQRIIVTGASGLIGSQLTAFLTSGGHEVVRLVRGKPASPAEAHWNPATREIDAQALEGTDAVVHLAGESIAARRWSARAKDRILRSRIEGTRLLSETLAQLKRPPRVLISASAIGYYGARGEEVLTESDGPGKGFLADVCRQWEAATEPAERAGIRVVTPRIGMVVTARGGALASMLPVFRAGLGGRLGNGRQWMSWVALDDLIGIMHHLIFTDVRGAVNATSPHQATNAEFTRTLGRVLHRPTLLRVPAFALRAMFGEMGRALLLEGARVRPAALEASGFRFLYPTLENALRCELGIVSR